MKILDRYVLSEMFFPFLAGVAAFTVLFMSVSSSELISNMIAMGSEGGGWLVTRYILSSIPQVFVFTFPMAVLLSTLLSFGRLSGDSEIIAMKAGGVSFFRISFPGLLLTFLISLFALVMMDRVVPDANYTATNILMTQVLKQAQTERENLVFSDMEEDGSERRIFAKSLDEKNGFLRGVAIFYFKDNHRTREVYAPRAVWQNNVWKLIEPRTYDFDEEQGIKYESKSAMGRLPLVESPQDMAKRDRKPDEMSRTALGEKLAIMRDVGQANGNAGEEYVRTYRKLSYNYHQKLALPFSCLVFGLFGIPLGVRPHRTSTSIGLGLSLVFILLYYVLMTLGRALGENGTLTPLLGAWLPNMVFGVMGAYMIIRASRS